MKQIQSIYGSRIKFIFRNFPLTMHDKAYDAAVAAEAAGMQGRDKFWAMQNQLYTNQQAWTNDPNYRQVLSDYAQKTIGLDVDRFQTDMAGIADEDRGLMPTSAARKHCKWDRHRLFISTVDRFSIPRLNVNASDDHRRRDRLAYLLRIQPPARWLRQVRANPPRIQRRVLQIRR